MAQTGDGDLTCCRRPLFQQIKLRSGWRGRCDIKLVTSSRSLHQITRNPKSSSIETSSLSLPLHFPLPPLCSNGRHHQCVPRNSSVPCPRTHPGTHTDQLPDSLKLPPHLSAHKYFFVCSLTVAAWDTLVLSPRTWKLLRTKEWPVLKIIYHFIRIFMPICFTVTGPSPSHTALLGFLIDSLLQPSSFLTPTGHRKCVFCAQFIAPAPSDANAWTLELQEDLPV